MSKYPNGVIAYEGESQLDGQPIVLILTRLETKSKNDKTGAMVQAIVLTQNQPPTEAIKDESDVSICGDCPLKRSVCYVNLVPMNTVWHGYQRGIYPAITQDVLDRARDKGSKLRITAYGDPSAVPLEVWQNLLEYFEHHTGYTHQWRKLDLRWSLFLMASCETEEDVRLAASRGWSTFRVRSITSPKLVNEIQCPNSMNPEIQCVSCRLCSGSDNYQRHITINVHGLDWKLKNFEAITTR